MAVSGVAGNGRHLTVEANGTGNSGLSELPVTLRRRVSAGDAVAEPPGLVDPPVEPDRSYVPTDIEIKAELWRIGIGDGTESSRVSALRALADMLGMMRPTAPEMPEGMAILLDALSRGLDRDAE